MQQRWGGMRINVRKMKRVSDIEKFINIACELVENKGKNLLRNLLTENNRKTSSKNRARRFIEISCEILS